MNTEKQLCGMHNPQHQLQNRCKQSKSSFSGTSFKIFVQKEGIPEIAHQISSEVRGYKK
jgi:hypothetical protein